MAATLDGITMLTFTPYQQEGASLAETAGIAAPSPATNYLSGTRQIIKALGVGRLSDKTLAEVATLLFGRRPPPTIVLGKPARQLPKLRRAGVGAAAGVAGNTRIRTEIHGSPRRVPAAGQ